MPIEKKLRYGSSLHKFVLEAVLRRYKYSKDKMENRHDKWRKADDQFNAYMPETEVDTARRSVRDKGMPQYTTIYIPHSYAIMMTAHTYHTSVFYSRSPVFQYEGTSGDSEDSKFAVEALIDYQARKTRMTAVGYQWFSDVLKYSLGVVGTYWDDMQVIVNQVEDIEDEFLGVGLGTTTKQYVRKAIRSYSGNRVYNVRPYDFFPDPRVSPGDLQKGEFCGIIMDVSWNHIVKQAANGKYINVGVLRTLRNTSYINRAEGGISVTPPDRPGSTSYLDLMDMSNVSLLEMYVELSPREWGLGEESFPEKWVFVIANESVILAARPLGCYNNEFPFDVLETEADGYSMFKQSIVERTQPFEDLMNWLINTHFYNTRRMLNGMFVADPSRVVMKDILEGGHGGVIRLKEEAYGMDARTALAQLPVGDVTRSNISDMEMVNQLVGRFTGINDNIMGMVNAGGRKTATEVRSSTTFGINRLKTQAEWFSATGVTSLSQRLLQNSQQYYDESLMLRIVGDTARFAGLKHLKITPEDITGFYDFVPVDGVLPVDRFAQVSMWSQLLAQVRNAPQIMQMYDMGKIFGWIAQLGGIRNIEQFKIEVLPDQQLGDQAQRGNVVAMNGQPPGRGQTREGGTPYTSPTPGVGNAG